jgi:hypothetical protein
MEPQPITGYRNLSPDEIAAINEIKAVAATVDALVQKVSGAYFAIGQPGDVVRIGGAVDQRWVAIAKTQLQQGFMALTRSIAQPNSF